jgi:hypothetical protein
MNNLNFWGKDKDLVFNFISEIKNTSFFKDCIKDLYIKEPGIIDNLKFIYTIKDKPLNYTTTAFCNFNEEVLKISNKLNIEYYFIDEAYNYFDTILDVEITDEMIESEGYRKLIIL